MKDDPHGQELIPNTISFGEIPCFACRITRGNQPIHICLVHATAVLFENRLQVHSAQIDS
jgi:hypothetical protein